VLLVGPGSGLDRPTVRVFRPVVLRPHLLGVLRGAPKSHVTTRDKGMRCAVFCSTFCCFFLMDAATETLRWFLEQCLGSVVALRRNRQHGVEGIHWWILDLRLAGGRKKKKKFLGSAICDKADDDLDKVANLFTDASDDGW
jgi:hypothetical protein